MSEPSRSPLLDALDALNNEGFNAIAWMVYQQAKTAGGFTDHEGWKRVLDACLQLPYIAATQARFDEAYKKLDDELPTQVVPITPEPGGIVGPGGIK